MAKAFKYKVNDRVKTINGQWGTITKLESKGTFPYLITWDESGRTERYKEKNFDDWKWKVHSSADEEVEPNQAALDFSRGCYEWKVGDRVLPKINPDYPADEQWQPRELIVRNADDQENIEVFNPQFPEEYSIIAGRFLEPCLPIEPLPSVITAQASAQVMPLQDCSLDSSLLVCANATNGVKASSDLDIQTLISPQISTNWTAHKSQSKSSRSRPRASRSASKAKGKEPQIKETVSLELFEQSNGASPSSSQSKTSPDYLAVLLNPDSPQVHTLKFSGEPSTKSGMSLNGNVSAQASIAAPLLEKDYFWLDSPGALSSDSSRPSGQSKLEASLKKTGHLLDGECINPIYLEGAFTIPEEWSNPLEFQPATALLADVEKPLGIAWTPELPPSPSEESSISIPSLKSEEELTPVDKSAVGKHYWCDRLTVAVEILTVHNWRETPKSPELILGARCRPWWTRDKWGSKFPKTIVLALHELVEIEEFSSEYPQRSHKYPTHSLEKPEIQTESESKQTGSLYQYTGNRAGKDGVIREYPRVEGKERDRAIDDDWYWGISYVEKVRGKWRDKSASIPRWSLPLARQLMSEKVPVHLTIEVCQLKVLWLKQIGDYLIGETKPEKCPRLFIFSQMDRELFRTGPSWGESTPAYRQRKREELSSAIASGKPFEYIKELLK
jgi:hypothetical protein